jgi:Low molecular weight phosphotyrosine protein phosphatase
VQPVFRSTPWEEEAKAAAAGSTSARILFVSESNVCRSVLAEVTMRELLKAHDMHDMVTCESRGSKDYNIGDPPDAMLQQVAAELDLRCARDLSSYVLSGAMGARASMMQHRSSRHCAIIAILLADAHTFSISWGCCLVCIRS